MKIAVINETSAGDKNADIIKALAGFDHEVLNLGMRQKGGSPELTYIETGLLTGLLLHIGAVDFVIGGCGTGQGYLCSAMQYPGVFCGLIQEPTDAWLFGQINGGNCIALALNKGYGWAGNVNLEFIFQRLFSVDFGCGYPKHRQASQQKSRQLLQELSQHTHRSWVDIVDTIDKEVLRRVLTFPGIWELLVDSKMDEALYEALEKHHKHMAWE